MLYGVSTFDIFQILPKGKKIAKGKINIRSLAYSVKTGLRSKRAKVWSSRCRTIMIRDYYPSAEFWIWIYLYMWVVLCYMYIMGLKPL